MRLPIFHVDAFADRLFAGNPAAVCPLPRWLPDETLQAIAAENALSETAFLVREEAEYAIRWMTPLVEVDLCGHATLASAHVVFEKLEPGRSRVAFSSKSGLLAVTKEGNHLSMVFPRHAPRRCPAPPGLIQGLKHSPREVLSAVNLLAVYGTEAEVRALEPDMAAIARLPAEGVIVTAPGRDVDFVSRYFAPRAGIPEDPVTGSAHCSLVPYWSERLGKKQLRARQISRRGGELFCHDRGDAVVISGRAVTYLEGTIEVP